MTFHKHVRSILNAVDNFLTVSSNNIRSIKSVYDAKDDDSISILKDILDIDVDKMNELIGLDKVKHENDVIHNLKSSLHITISNIGCHFSMTSMVPNITNMLGKVASLCEASVPKDNSKLSLDDTCGETYFKGVELIKEIGENHKLLDDFSKDYEKNHMGSCSSDMSDMKTEMTLSKPAVVGHDL